MSLVKGHTAREQTCLEKTNINTCDDLYVSSTIISARDSPRESPIRRIKSPIKSESMSPRLDDHPIKSATLSPRRSEPQSTTPRPAINSDAVPPAPPSMDPVPKGLTMIPDWKMDMASMCLGIDQRLLSLEHRVAELERAANEPADEKPKSSNSLFKKIFICIH